MFGRKFDSKVNRKAKLFLIRYGQSKQNIQNKIKTSSEKRLSKGSQKHHSNVNIHAQKIQQSILDCINSPTLYIGRVEIQFKVCQDMWFACS